MDLYQKRFWIFLLLLTGLRLWFIGQFELAPDEAYYWTWSRHLDWAYYDQGPMLALVIRFFTGLTRSSTEWSVRLGAVTLSVFSAWMFFSLIRRIFGSTRAAWFGSLAMQAALLFSAGAILMMHDSIMMCAWIGGLLAFYRAWCEDWKPGWAWGALALGLGALAKYTMALFIPGLLLFLLLSPRQRRWWGRPPLYLTGLAVLALVSPLVFWNAGHGWASFGHIAVLGGVHRPAGLSLKNLGDFLGGQLAVMTPLLGALSLISPLIAWREWKKGTENSERYLFLGCFVAPVLLIFLFISLKTPVYANWPAPAYPAALAILAAQCDALLRTGRTRLALGWMRTALILGAFLTLAAHVEVAWGFPALTGHAADSVNRIRGWRDLGSETGRRLQLLKMSGRPEPFLAAKRYQVAAELSFYAPGQPEVQLLPPKQPPENQFDIRDRSELFTGQDALVVCEDASEADSLRPDFVSIEALPGFAARASGRPVREIRFYLGRRYNARGAIGFARLLPRKETL